MGSCGHQADPYALSDANMLHHELRLLQVSGLPDREIRQENVVVGDHKGSPVYIHTLFLGDQNPRKPTLVLTHGYGGSGALLYKILRPLADRFRLIVFDLPGMGCSSRSADFKESQFTPEDCIDYFCAHIETWRNILGLTQFVLAAHSFGGFICGNYACKYPQHLQKLILLSPIGVRYSPDYERLSEQQKNQLLLDRFNGGSSSIGFSFVQWGWGKRMSPFTFVRMAPRGQALKWIANYVRRRQPTDSEEEAAAIVDYMYQIFNRAGTTEFGLNICFDLSLYCKATPLAHPSRLGNAEFPVPVSFVYGQHDWVRRVDEEAGRVVVEANSHPSSRLHFLQDSDHNMHMDNPEGLVRILVSELEN